MSDRKRIIMIGDSLIEWFDWAGRFPAHDIHNLGISGETVDGMLNRLTHVTQSLPSADKIFILSGINNVSMEDTSIIKPYRKALREFRQAYAQAEIYVISLLPTLVSWIQPNTISILNEKLEDLAHEEGARYIDAHSEFNKHGVKEMLTEDGIHIAPSGYAVLSAALEPYIK